MTRSELTFSSRLASCPVAATRCPTLAVSACRSAGSTRTTGAGRFLKKPVRQLRDFGASAPSTSLRRKVSPSVLTSRQPVMVTGAGTTIPVEVVAGEAGVSGAAGVGVGSSCLGGSAAVSVAATGASDFPDPVSRFVTGFTVDLFGCSLTARAVATMDAAGGAALSTGAAIGAGAIDGVLGATATAGAIRS